MRIPLVDLKAQYDSIKEDIDDAVRRVIEGGEFILGPEVKAFEQEMATYLGVKYAVGVASGTDALQLALLACGINPGDEVITSPFTFIATAEAITQCGARPVFVDIDPRTYNIDPQKLQELLSTNPTKSPHRHCEERSDVAISANSTNATNAINSVGQPKAVIPVHLYGQPADMDPIIELAQKYNLRVIEDCAQSLGAVYYSHQSAATSRLTLHPPVIARRDSAVAISTNATNPTNAINPTNSRNSSRVGALGDAGCLSFFPSKVLGAYGDGGMVVTNDPDIAEGVAMLRNHGCKQKYYHLVPGFNSRLDELQAAILRVKLRHLDDWIDQRRQKAALYSELLGQIKGIDPPFVAPYGSHVFNYYTIRLTSNPHPPVIRRVIASEAWQSKSQSNTKSIRDKLQRNLTSQGIAAAIYYPLSLHLQEVYKTLGRQPGDFPNSEQAQAEVLSLPIYPELTIEQMEKIVEVLKQFVEGDSDQH